MYIITKKTTEYARRIDKYTGKPKKTWYVVEEKEPEQITREAYQNMVDAQQWMKQLGGREYATRSYTAMGYVPIRLTSVSPDKMRKFTWEFTIKYKENK